MNLRKYIYAHCLAPQELKIWDTYSQSYVVQSVPCGCCLHCQNTAVNEWVTRLYAQAQDSAHIYYITLDYAPFSYSPDTFSDLTAERLAIETAATWQNLNKYHRYGMQPLLLKKIHLQQFFKRFRKNTGIKIQYFACGEYGTHAEGKGYGRPHFHAIIFSDIPITHQQFTDAWSLDGYKIGNVDFHDITAQAKNVKLDVGTTTSAKYCFKYVCKYLKKQGFDFESLSTIDFHRAYFRSTLQIVTKSDTLFPEIVPLDLPSNREYVAELWKKYISDYSPFVVCSKRPAIGLSYLKRNVQRFAERDFRLFGLPKECITFPRYYLRKTKEFLCPLWNVGEISQKPSSSSRLGYIASVLDSLSADRLDFQNFTEPSQNHWCIYGNKILKPYEGADGYIPISVMHLYDTSNNIFYQFNGYTYTLWQKIAKLGYKRLDVMSIEYVSQLIKYHFTPYKANFIDKLHNSKVIREGDLTDSISALYNGDTYDDKYNKFLTECFYCYQQELATKYRHKLLTNNSKISF